MCGFEDYWTGSVRPDAKIWTPTLLDETIAAHNQAVPTDGAATFYIKEPRESVPVLNAAEARERTFAVRTRRRCELAATVIPRLLQLISECADAGESWLSYKNIDRKLGMAAMESLRERGFTVELGRESDSDAGIHLVISW